MITKDEYFYLADFIGNSFAKVSLICKNKKLFVCKEVKGDSSLGTDKLRKQVEWIINLSPRVKKFFPEIVDHKFEKNLVSYTMEFLKLPTLREVIINSYMDLPEIVLIFNKICNFIFKDFFESKKSKVRPHYIRDEHLKKMNSRLESTIKENDFLKKLMKQKEVYVNGRKLINYPQIYKKLINDKAFIKTLTPKRLGCIHGDLTFNNILSDGKNFYFIDPRGEGQDDIFYDVGKLLQSSNGKYDLIEKGLFKADYSHNSINFKITQKENETLYNLIDAELWKIFESNKNITETKDWRLKALFFETSMFISLLPFRQRVNPVSTIVCYGVGLNLLNEVYQEWLKLKQ